MKLAPTLLSVAVLLIGTVAPSFAAPKQSSQQAVVVSVSPGHITIRHNQTVPTEWGKTKSVPVDTTYNIDQFTRAEVNGQRAEISLIREGMIASVSGNLNTSTKERTATMIIARDKAVQSVVKKPHNQAHWNKKK